MAEADAPTNDNVVWPQRFLGSERSGPLTGGGSGDGGGSVLDSRVARLESHVEHIQRDTTELKADVKQIRADVAEMKGELKVVKEQARHLATTAQVYQLGIAAIAFSILAVGAIIGFAPKLWQLLGTAP